MQCLCLQGRRWPPARNTLQHRSHTCHRSGQTHLCFGGGQGTTGQLCVIQARNTHYLQPGAYSQPTSPSPPVSHRGSTGHHHLVTVVLCSLAFSPQTKAQLCRGSRRVFCHLLKATSTLFSTPAPSPAGNISRTSTGCSSPSRDRNILEFDNKKLKKIK